MIEKQNIILKSFSDLGVESIIYTDISKDGLMKGPNLEKISILKILLMCL